MSELSRWTVGRSIQKRLKLRLQMFPGCPSNSTGNKILSWMKFNSFGGFLYLKPFITTDKFLQECNSSNLGSYFLNQIMDLNETWHSISTTNYGQNSHWIISKVYTFINIHLIKRNECLLKLHTFSCKIWNNENISFQHT